MDCVKTLETILCTRLGYLYFTKYIEEVCNGKKLLDLFNLIMIRKEREKNNKLTYDIENSIDMCYESNLNLNLIKLFPNNIGKFNRYELIMEELTNKFKEYYKSFKTTNYLYSLERDRKRVV